MQKLKVDDITHIDTLIEAYPGLRWKVESTPEGGKSAYTILSGDRQTGKVIVLAAIENASAPKHLHISGEYIWTLGGTLLLGIVHPGGSQDDGCPPVETTLGPGEMIWLQAGSVHQPSAQGFWFGIYMQPAGSQPV